MSSSDKRADSGLRDVSGQNELRVQVAELLGWKGPDHPDVIKWCDDAMNRAHSWWQGPNGKYSAPIDESKIPYGMADYPNDLNACAQFETIVLANGLRKQYANNLALVITADSFTQDILADDFDLIHARAEQRCRAFVKTMEARSVPDGNDSSSASGVSSEKEQA